MPELSPQISFPGVIAPISANYCCSHGISPGTATLTCVEQETLPAMIGDLVLGDGVTQILVPGCVVDNIKLSVYGNGDRIWTIFLKDRRWKWIGYGATFGCYNQTDPNSKLIGWTIRSPEELAKLCLADMGETNYLLNLPPGLNRAWGANLQNFLQVGENFPLTGLNPPFNWQGENPAIALQQVAETFGSRVVYDVMNDRVLVTPIGVGSGLPDGYVRQFGPSIKQVPVPDGIMVLGGRTKYQMRLLLEPVGIEWDGSYRPLEQLSYAPVQEAKKQISTFRVRNTLNPLGSSAEWTVGINGERQFYASSPGDALSDVVTTLVGFFPMIDARLGGGVITAAADGLDIIVTAVRAGVGFNATGSVVGDDPDDPTLRVDLTQAASVTRGFAFSDPDSFADVVSTDRLTYDAARLLALESVFRCYRVVNTGLNGRGRIYVPGVGFIKRRQQLLLTDTQVEQIAPELPNPNFLRPNQDLDPNMPLNPTNVLTDFIENFYNGYSRDKPAVCYGSFSEIESDVFYTAMEASNTVGNQRIFVDFSIDPVWQVVKFARPVYRWIGDGSGRKAASKVTLETGCYLREENSNQFVSYALSRRFTVGGPTSFYEIQRHEDVQLGVIGSYNFRATGRVPGSGLVQVAVLDFRNIANPSNFNAAYPQAGTGWKVRVGGAEYAFDSTIGQTPLDVATHFASVIPSTGEITVALMPGGGPRIRFTGVRTGFAFSLEADPPDMTIPAGIVVGATVNIAVALTSNAQPAVPDQVDYASVLSRTRILEADPIFRANYYLNGMLLKYQVKATQTVVYNTVMPIGCDGAIAQVTWEVGGGRPVQTVASLNCEHSDWVPPFPVRRRAEALPPVLVRNVDLGRDGGDAGRREARP